MSYISEPPLVIQGFRWTRTKLPGTEVEVDVEIELSGPFGFFDKKKRLDIKEVRAATVRKVTISPPRLD
jgi:hypothetical protein